MKTYFTTGRMHPDPRDGGWVLLRDAQKLADALQALTQAANNRGRLEPGGCDHNTDTGAAYAQAQEALAFFNDPTTGGL